MDYNTLINNTIYDGIDRTFFQLVQQSGDEAAVQADILGCILRRKLSEYIDEAVKNIRQSFGGDKP